MYIKQILFVIEGLVRVLGGECVCVCVNHQDRDSVTIRLRLFDIDIAGKVGINPQSQTTPTGQ